MFEREVNAGIEYFVTTDGSEFYKKIDIDRLDMASSCDCMFGQLGESYTKERFRRGVDNRQAIKLGLYLHDDLVGWNEGEYYARLTETWQKKLREMVEFDIAVGKVLEGSKETVNV